MQATELGPDNIGQPIEVQFNEGVTKIVGATLVSYVDVTGDPEKGTVDGRVLVLDLGVLGPEKSDRYMTVFDRDIKAVLTA